MNALKRKMDDSTHKLHGEIQAIGKMQRELEAKLSVDSQQHQQDTQALQGQLEEVLRMLRSKQGVSGGGVGGGGRDNVDNDGDEPPHL